MDNAALKKWFLLGGLLLLTLILVWQAPEPDQADVIEATKPAVGVSSRRSVPALSDIDEDEIRLMPRHQLEHTVDLFAVPEETKSKPVIRPVRKPVVEQPDKRIELPFDYIGKFHSDQKTTFFLMEGSRLYLVHEGDTINDLFRLQHIDTAANELVWLYLPSQETRKMSMDR